jgi:hypothetical protein
MQWSAVTWRSANPIRPAGARTLVVPWRPYIRCSTGRCLRRCRRLQPSHYVPAFPGNDRLKFRGWETDGPLRAYSYRSQLGGVVEGSAELLPWGASMEPVAFAAKGPSVGSIRLRVSVSLDKTFDSIQSRIYVHYMPGRRYSLVTMVSTPRWAVHSLRYVSGGEELFRF